MARAVQVAGRPVVDVSAARLLPKVPWVETDDAAVAAAAFDHLRGQGLTHFGYAGDDRFNWSRWRQEHFTRLTTAVGFDFAVCPGTARESWGKQRATTTKWLAELPRPVGVLACYDPCVLGRAP